MVKNLSVSLACILAFVVVPVMSAQNVSDPKLGQINLALAKDPGNFKLLMDKAERLGELGRFEDELVVARKLAIEYPNERGTYTCIVQAEQGVGNHGAALAAVNKLMVLPSTKEYDYVMRSMLLSRTGKYVEALSDANRALKKFPEERGLYVVRAKCNYKLKGACPEAIADLKKALSITPDDQQIKALLAKIQSELTVRTK